MAAVTRAMLAWSRLPRTRERWMGMWWSPRLAAILRMAASEGAQLSWWLSRAVIGVFPVDVGVGMPVVAGAGADAAGAEVGPGQPGVVGADQFGGGGVAGEAGGVADQRARPGVGGHWSFTSVMAARTAVVSAMVLCVV